MKNKLEDLRNHLFAALEGLADEKQPLEIERARAISDVAQTIINSAKLELDMVRALDGRMVPSEFFPTGQVQAPHGPQRPALRGAVG